MEALVYLLIFFVFIGFLIGLCLCNEKKGNQNNNTTLTTPVVITSTEHYGRSSSLPPSSPRPTYYQPMTVVKQPNTPIRTATNAEQQSSQPSYNPEMVAPNPPQPAASPSPRAPPLSSQISIDPPSYDQAVTGYSRQAPYNPDFSG